MSPSPLSLPKVFLGRLRFPWLFAILAGLWLFDMVTPDPILWLDEIMLAVMTVMFGVLKKRRDDGASKGSSADRPQDRPPEKDITPS